MHAHLRRDYARSRAGDAARGEMRRSRLARRCMDLKSGYPWWAIRNGLMHAFPPLQATCAATSRCSAAASPARWSPTNWRATATTWRSSNSATSAGAAPPPAPRCCSTRSTRRWSTWRSATARTPRCWPTRPAPTRSRCLGDWRAPAARHRLRAPAEPVLRQQRRHRSDLEDEFALRQRHGFDVEWLQRTMCATATASMRRARSSAASAPASIPTASPIAC